MRNLAMQLSTKTLSLSRAAFVFRLFVLCVLEFIGTAGAQTFSLTVNTLGSGSVSASPAGPYAAGTLVTLTPSPASGWTFSSWSGNLTGYATPGTLIVNGNYTVTATFDQVGYAGVTGDPRTVTEPTFPPVCTTLLAQQSSSSLNQSVFDTARLQTAINNCPAGQAVNLSPSGSNNAFLTQPIVLKAGVTLLIDAEVTLFGSNNLGDYKCTDTACTHLIQVAPNTGTPGSAIMGYGTIDGQGSFCWDINASGGQCPRMIFVGDPNTHASSDNFTLYKTTLQNSTKFHLYAISNGLTVWGAKISTSGAGTNTDGIDPSASSNITIRDSFISDGDDHIAFKAGFGPVSNVTVTHNHLYYGHGLSMGSETNGGITNVLATDNVIDQNGCANCSSSNDIRIKSDVSRGGEVKNVLYQDTCIRNAGTQPHEFVFDPNFDPSATGNLIPFFHDIHLHNVHMVDAGNFSTFTGKDASRVLTMFMDNVVWGAFNSNDFTSASTTNAAFTLGPGPVSFASTLAADAPSDTNVKVTNDVSNSNAAYDCSGRFVYLAGELFTKTPTVSSGSPVTLTSVLQPAISGSAGPTGTISILEGATVIASGSISGRITKIAVPSVSAGTHTYTASYGGDANYAQLYYGKVTVTASGGGPDFSISASPGSQTVTAGAGTSYTATVNTVNGFTGTVNLSVSGLPSAATSSLNPTSVAGSGNSTLSLSTGSTTPAGTYTLTITGTSGSLTHSTSVTLVVNATPTPDFSISASPGSQTVTAGAGTSYTTTLSAVNGFTGTVNLSVSGLPSGAASSFNPTSVAAPGNSTLSVSTSSTIPAGTYTLTITGTSGSLTHSTSVTLVVNAAVTGDFSIATTPSSQTVTEGGSSSTTYTTTVTAVNGFTGTVGLSVSGLPNGVTGGFNPTSIAGSGSSTLSVSASSQGKVGTYTLTIKGASGSLIHSTTVTLVVKSEN
jgi:polygalacturonase